MHEKICGAMSPAEFCQRFGVGLTKLYSEIAAGRITARKLGRRTIILDADAQVWADRLPTICAKTDSVSARA